MLSNSAAQENGIARPSLISRILMSKEELTDEEEDCLIWVAMTMYAGGIDTVS